MNPSVPPTGSEPPHVEDPELVKTLRETSPGRLVFDRFRLERELGEGGMGIVWLVLDEKLDRRPVALKFLSGIITRDDEALADLRREIRHGLDINHAGIVRVYDLHESKSERLAAIAMEFVDGKTLSELKNECPNRCFDPDEILSWLGQLCEILDYLHREARVVHRDLKPRNLMLTQRGQLKLADFGIASAIMESHSRLSKKAPGATSGTPCYMSPQQMKGMPARPSDDIYALGATLFELLTGKPPFFRGLAAAILAQVETDSPPTLAARRAELGVAGRAPLPSKWEETVALCLAKTPEDRPASAGEVFRRLASLQDLAPQETDDVETIKVRSKQGKVDSTGKKRRIAVVKLSVAAVVIAALTVFGMLRRTDHPAVDRAETPKPVITAVPIFEGAAGIPEIKGSVTEEPKQPVEVKPSAESRSDEAVEQGRLLRDRGDTYAAVTKLREAETYAPESPAPKAELAITLDKMGFAEKATEYWKSVYAMGESAGAYYEAAKAKMDLARTETIGSLTDGPAQPDAGSGGISSRSEFSLGDITRTDDSGSQLAERVLLHVPVKVKAHAFIHPQEVYVSVVFYDKVGGDKIEVNTESVWSAWANPQPDWSGRGIETFEATYACPRPARGKTVEKRNYYGYVASIYYCNALQDFRSDPPEIAEQFVPPPKLSWTAQSQPFLEFAQRQRYDSLASLEPSVIVPTSLRSLPVRPPLKSAPKGKQSRSTLSAQAAGENKKHDGESVDSPKPPTSSPNGGKGEEEMTTILQFENFSRTDEYEPSASQRFALHAEIRATPEMRINPKDVTVRVLVYDIVEGRQLEINKADVISSWAEPPPDWREHKLETLNIIYARPLPAKGEITEDRKFYGYIATIYYRGYLQDVRSDPPNLAQRVQVPRTLPDSP